VLCVRVPHTVVPFLPNNCNDFYFYDLVLENDHMENEQRRKKGIL
jgi:hypothetical protein